MTRKFLPIFRFDLQSEKFHFFEQFI